MKRIAVLGPTQGTEALFAAFPDRLRLVQNLTEADLVVAAPGAAVVETLEALAAGVPVVLMCPELMVLAGEQLIAASRNQGAPIIPADPTLSAVWQSLRGEPSPVKRLVLVFSDPVRLGALAIAAHHLFDIPFERMEVVTHPQGVLQAMVEFADGSMKAVFVQAEPLRSLQHALSYPERWDSDGAVSVDLIKLGQLTFEPVACLDEAIATARACYPESPKPIVRGVI